MIVLLLNGWTRPTVNACHRRANVHRRRRYAIGCHHR